MLIWQLGKYQLNTSKKSVVAWGYRYRRMDTVSEIFHLAWRRNDKRRALPVKLPSSKANDPVSAGEEISLAIWGRVPVKRDLLVRSQSQQTAREPGSAGGVEFRPGRHLLRDRKLRPLDLLPYANLFHWVVRLPEVPADLGPREFERIETSRYICVLGVFQKLFSELFRANMRKRWLTESWIEEYASCRGFGKYITVVSTTPEEKTRCYLTKLR